MPITAIIGKLKDDIFSWMRMAYERRLIGKIDLKLLIIDDIYPLLQSPFRITEFDEYLKRWDEVEVHSTINPALLELFKIDKSGAEIIADYEARHPQFEGHIKIFNRHRKVHSKLGYTVFLGNAIHFLKYFEFNEIEFIFSLYPGGAFCLNQRDSDSALRKICGSNYFRKVIVTQQITKKYLLEKEICNPQDIVFIYGGVFPSSYYLAESAKYQKKYYNYNKNTFDICFVANKYMEGGRDKGYDIFIEVARILTVRHPDIRLHVIGGFDESDVDVDAFSNRIHFYGNRTTEFFPGFYSSMDIILSPNVPFVLAPGAFDGFPTGSCIEAGFCGVAVFCTDILNQNIFFEDGKDIVIISMDVEQIVKDIEYYFQNLSILYSISRNGKRSFDKIFDQEYQLGERIKILNNYI